MTYGGLHGSRKEDCSKAKKKDPRLNTLFSGENKDKKIFSTSFIGKRKRDYLRILMELI